MYISSLTLTNFRSHEYKEYTFDKNTTIITGKNGAGKTNIIEAIAYLSSLRSHRTNCDTDMIMFDKKYCTVLGEFDTNIGKQKINILISDDNSKKIKYNNQDVKKSAEVVGRLNTVIFSPDTLEIIKDSPDKRRKFIDIAISKIDRKYFGALQMYKKVLRQKNKLLKHYEGKESSLELDTYNDLLAENGSYIEYKRCFFVSCVNSMIGDIYYKLTGNSDNVCIAFEAQLEADNKSIDQIRTEYTSMLEEIREKEIEKHRALKGAHLDDITFYLNNRNAKKYCSQGQQRIILLALLFSQTEIALTETGEKPVVLLDDVLSELDNERKRFVLEYISTYQTFITTANDESSFLPYLKEHRILKL